MKYLVNIGRYFIMIKEAFGRMTKRSVLYKLVFQEINDLIIKSLGIVCFLSFFIGGVLTIQTSLNLGNPLIPKSLIGYTTRQGIILEFSPTLISIIMAGKMGSFVTSSIGTMRVTEQIDALEVMGINSVNYLVLPKIIAMMTYPFLIAISMGMGILGGYLTGAWGGFVVADDFIEGLKYDFQPFQLLYAFVKSVFFAWVLATVPAFFGYYVKGGSVDVGKASTSSFVWTSVILIIINYVLTQLLLSS